MPKFVLHYFNMRGRAEMARLLFHYHGVEFEDKRHTREEWPELKKNDNLFPFAQLPVLEVDGKVLAQSFAIFRYLANEYGSAGKNNFEKAVVDMLADAMMDMISIYVKEVFMEQDADKKAAAEKRFVDEVVPDHLKRIEKVSLAHSEANGFLVGDSVTWVDFMILSFGHRRGKEIFNSAPALKAVFENINSLPQIQDYLKTRPETEM